MYLDCITTHDPKVFGYEITGQLNWLLNFVAELLKTSIELRATGSELLTAQELDPVATAQMFVISCGMQQVQPKS